MNTETEEYLYDSYMSMKQTDKELFLRDKNSRYRTQSLFYEHRHPDYDCILTLKPYDYKGCRSLKQIYMALNDPTEALVATEVFTSAEHWKTMTELVWFRDILAEWREELELRLRGAALQNLVAQSTRSTAAAQFLAKGAWKDQRGRPTREEKAGALKKSIGDTDKITELFNRATKNL